MPWKRAKALPPPSNELFDACFRIQREACEATRRTCRACGGEAVTRGLCRCEVCDGKGWTERHIPLVVENVCGAQKWVGRARWHYGSFYLWGDVPALMPMTLKAIKGHGGPWFKDAETADGTYGAGNFRVGVDRTTKNDGGSWFAVAHNTTSGHGQNPDGRKAPSGTQWFNDGPRTPESLASMGGKSSARKAASAHIAKIPYALARHIARAWKPLEQTA
jgi:hypothetical protein